MIIVILIVLLMSSIAGGLIFWKLQTPGNSVDDDNESVDDDNESVDDDNESVDDTPAKLGESCSEKNCETPLICDGTSMLCTPAPVPCVGSWSRWSSCSAPDCYNDGTQNRTFNVNVNASNGGAPCEFANGETDTQSCKKAGCSNKPVYFRYSGKDINGHDIEGSSQILGTLSEHLQHCNSLKECNSFNRKHDGTPRPGSRVNGWFKRDTATTLENQGAFDFYSKTNIPFDKDNTPAVIEVNADGTINQEKGCWPKWDLSKQGFVCTIPPSSTKIPPKRYEQVINKLYAPGGWGGYGHSLETCKSLCTDWAKYGNAPLGIGANGCKGFYWEKNREPGPICSMISNDDIATNIVDDPNVDLYIMKDA